MSDIAEHLLHYRKAVDVEWGTLYDKIEEATKEIARLHAENENLKTYISERLPADHIAALLQEVVTGGRRALRGEP